MKYSLRETLTMLVHLDKYNDIKAYIFFKKGFKDEAKYPSDVLYNEIKYILDNAPNELLDRQVFALRPILFHEYTINME